MGNSESHKEESYQEVYDLVCRKCGRIIRNVRLREIDRNNPVCAACDK